MDKKSVLLSLWQKFVNRFYKSGECEGLMEDVLKPSVSYYEEPKERGSKRGIRFLKRNSWLKV